MQVENKRFAKLYIWILAGILLAAGFALMNVYGVYYDTDLYKYGILVSALVLVLIALLSWEQPLVPVKWGGLLQTAWFLLWGWVCLPDWLGTNIVYANEVLETDLSAPEMAEIEAMVPGYFAHVEHTTEHDVKMIWTNYLREMNFFGNENARVRVGRNWELAGNGLLEMAYRYGIFVLIPYTLLLISALYTAWKKKGYLMLATTLAFGFTMRTQNLEQSFL